MTKCEYFSNLFRNFFMTLGLATAIEIELKRV